MKILVTGSKGQLGFDVINELEKRGYTARGTDVEEMDITDSAAVKEVLSDVSPDAVIHCAAWTAVDLAEDEPEKVMTVNALGTKNIALVCEALGIKMMYISTDYVFGGGGTHFWDEDESGFAPLNVYGRTKYEGEVAVKTILEKYFIVRISWVFGVNGKNFVKTMLNLGKTREEISVVNDQFGSPTYTYDLSRLLVDMIETEKYGCYHATNEGVCTWYDFAVEIFKTAGLNVKTVPVTSGQYPAKAKRPSNSRLSKEKLTRNGFTPLPAWQDAVKRCIEAMNNGG
ncbi:NAD(P)-dependent oxidoreductase [Synergistales bacterium]|nr:NAD(P)-dependent oxidoreductase [Synergistales bacterium]